MGKDQPKKWTRKLSRHCRACKSFCVTAIWLHIAYAAMESFSPPQLFLQFSYVGCPPLFWTLKFSQGSSSSALEAALWKTAKWRLGRSSTIAKQLSEAASSITKPSLQTIYVTAIQLSKRSPYSIANRFMAGFQSRKGIVQRREACLIAKYTTFRAD